MQIKFIITHLYEIPLTIGYQRSGIWLEIVNNEGKSGWGECAPLPKWSKETLEEVLQQIAEKDQRIREIFWTNQNCFAELQNLQLWPSLLFGLESALLMLLHPLPEFHMPTSALLMGTPKEIRQQAELRLCEGFISAKLKVGHLTFGEAEELIYHLKDQFHLRVDVNRAWKTEDAMQFFNQFSFHDFDYVEEPFQNPFDLARFLHPLAIDESFPSNLTLDHLEQFPTLKALIYKPTLQGGMTNCLPLVEWTTKRGINLILSSSFESDLGLGQIASIAHRCALKLPAGLGTYPYLKKTFYANSLNFCQPELIIS